MFPRPRVGALGLWTMGIVVVDDASVRRVGIVATGVETGIKREGVKKVYTLANALGQGGGGGGGQRRENRTSYEVSK